jgi:hypothetical protein
MNQIQNGDDLATALLLSLHGEILTAMASLSMQKGFQLPPSLPPLSMDDLLALSMDASHRGFDTIALRLQAALLHRVYWQLQLEEHAPTTGLAIRDEALVLAHRFFISNFIGCVFSDAVVYNRLLSTSSSATLTDKVTDKENNNDDQDKDNGMFHDDANSIRDKLASEIVHSQAGDVAKLLKRVPLHNEFMPSDTSNGHNDCVVPVVSLKSLTVKDFHELYVKRNVPVLIDLELSVDVTDGIVCVSRGLVIFCSNILIIFVLSDIQIGQQLH